MTMYQTTWAEAAVAALSSVAVLKREMSNFIRARFRNWL
jgi:hypothetical protein